MAATTVQLPFDKDFIEKVLTEKHGKKAKLVSMSEPTRIDEGKGFASHILSLQLAWEPSTLHLPAKVVIKLPNTAKARDSASKMDDGMDKIYEDFEQNSMFDLFHKNECAFYELFSDDVLVHIPLPIVYHTQLRTKDLPAMIVMEDFTSRGGCVNVFEGLTVNQALAIAEIVARYQAYSLLNDDWKTLFNFCDEKVYEQFLKSVESVYDAVKELYPEECSLISKDQIRELAQMDEKMRATVEFTGKYCVRVLAHGDLWINNVIFERKEGEFTNRILALIDWQLAHPSNPGEDLSRLLCTSMNDELRRSHEISIISHYYATLASLLRQHGATVPFGLKDAINWYYRAMRLQSVNPLFMVQLMKTEDPEKLRQAVLRGVHAIQDTLSFAKWDFLKT